MSSTTAWTCHYNAELDDDDHCKTAECAESFIALINAITGMSRSAWTEFSTLCVWNQAFSQQKILPPKS